jgi:hypothetical protein
MINNLNGGIAENKQAAFTVKICENYFKNIDGVILLISPIARMLQ